MRVLLITGGNSSERVVSLSSAKNVQKALIEKGHTVFIYDLRMGYEPLREVSTSFDILFPVLHGEEGEAGKLHKFLGTLEKPIVGTRNYKGLNDAWDKISFKKYCDKNAIPTSPWKKIKTSEEILTFGFPCVLKASNGGSSREVMILKSINDLENKSFEALMISNSPLFVERYIQGVEITVGVLNGKVLPFIEIIPPKNEWFSYENKYIDSTQEIPFAPSVGKDKQAEIAKIALKIGEDFDLGSYFRVDFIVDKKEFYTLEVNTIPGLTMGSLMPKQAKAAGISFNEFIEILIKNAK